MPPKVTMVRSQSTSCKAREVNALGGAAQGVDHTKLDRTTLRLGFSLVQASTLEKSRLALYKAAQADLLKQLRPPWLPAPVFIGSVWHGTPPSAKTERNPSHAQSAIALPSSCLRITLARLRSDKSRCERV